MCMVNFLKLIDVWDIIEKGYSPKYNAGTKVLTTESQLEKTKDESAINVILNFINEQIDIDFENSSNARDMWLALLNRYEEQDHFAFMAFGDKSSPHIDIDSIIASKNITDPTTLEIL